MSIASNIRTIKASIPAYVSLVAVTKTLTPDLILEAYHCGLREFGENRATDFLEKQAVLPKDIQWHFIGHLQRNKVRLIIPHVHLIHSIDSYRLLQEIEREASKIDRVINVLLQFHIAEEETKFGLDMDEATQMMDSMMLLPLKHVNIRGVMGMATYTDNNEQLKKEFRNLVQIFNQLKQCYFMNSDTFKEISMGMSGDYPLAIEEGSTMVRIGTALFGENH